MKFTDRIFGSAKPEKEPEKIEQEPAKPEKEVIREQTMVPEIRKILFATDLSQTARHAVRYACSIGNKYNAEVTVLHVIPDILEEFSSGAGIDLIEHMGKKKWNEFNKSGIEKARETIKARIAETSRRVLEEIPKCPVAEGNVIVEVGNPVNNIVSTAETGNYDLVIMGTHGHGKLEEFMIGSVSAGVIKRCPVPVLTAPLPIDS